ncbi:30S ribosomal protein S9 [Candidatus Campbellbacteria bacterium CG22_combo_CG10-13_8_21_14_all_36_13]|uniref:30S ribosomal protein S9 n=1 Tax=Candidatus Campbellbacteria bacterium CG22_combo_CG10-13_8_21_14_all_36_13 TaxID=1974529 RepID=A0A2H0DYL2_9BACT|nr:MAG: 30S ribosomal protein S9 [Candidatus Campbellbacteria bacterium CG22_combo_CG10-13_8_21_14_all_36_13]
MATKKESKDKYVEGIGRRKTSTARVRLTEGGAKHVVVVNDQKVDEYFKTDDQRKTAIEALNKIDGAVHYQVSAKVSGGGHSSQAEAVRHGISRALVLINQESRKPLKKVGFLKRDPRIKERKKPGLKKARKRPAWSKR